jgi:hypothetical protein
MLVANNRGMLQQLALGGQGIVQSADSWVQADQAAQRLVRVFMDYLVAQMAQPTAPT